MEIKERDGQEDGEGEQDENKPHYLFYILPTRETPANKIFIRKP